ncbi:MAG: M48 family metallopeptidase [Pseudomonadota bacterium]
MIQARYFDGQRSGGSEAQLVLLSEGIRLQLAEVSRTYARNELRVTPPVGHGDWVIELPDGGSLRVSDDDFVSHLSESLGGKSWVGVLEKKWRWAAAALVLTVSVVWAAVTIGIPAAAKQIAHAVPPDLEAEISEQSLSALDGVVFSPTALSREQQERLQYLFNEVRATRPEFSAYRMELRKSRIGPNAFAVPGGVVIMTDELVQLTASDDELLAVIAHEVGHLYERHGLRTLLQNSASAVLIASITGDLTNITAFAAAVPTLLLQSRYSRDFEREADAFAFQYLHSKDISTDVLSDLLIRMEQSLGTDDEGRLGSWFSSHPRSEERREKVSDSH